MALELGVSTATISNAFNRPDQLSAKLRERILRDAAKLGYHGPNLAARTLRRGESDVIGVILSDSLTYSFSDPVANQLLQGVSDVLVERNKHLLLLSSHVDSSEQRGAESLPDGFILYGTIDQTTFERVKRTGKPMVLVDFESDEVASVNIDNEKGAYKIASHALAKGTHEVAVLGLKLIDFDRVCRLTQTDLDIEYKEISRSRLKGFTRAAEENGCSFNPDSIWHIPINNTINAEIAAREALTKIPRPNVLLCMSDVIALTAIRVARELGLSVPNDVTITGFDGIPESERSNPPLSTVCQQSIEKGKLATKMLLDGESRELVVLETKLELRGSTNE